MTNTLARVAAACVFLLASALGAKAQDRTPSVDFESILDTFCHAADGTLRFDANVIAFAPEGPLAAEVAVLDPKGAVVSRFSYFEDAERAGVFAIAKVRGPAEVQLTEPGIYTLVYLVGGKPVTRMPIRLIATGDGADPFDPKPTFAFDGYWRTHAHFTMDSYEGAPVPELTMWIGGVDLPAGAKKDGFFVEMIHEGEVVAHSRRSQGHIPPGRFERMRLRLFQPHEEKASPNATPFMASDWKADGAYEVRVTRNSDRKVIRSFDFDVAGGKVVALPQAALDYAPHEDRILPRVAKKNVNVFEMIEAIWIRDGGNQQPPK
jgi:hypothetical protein